MIRGRIFWGVVILLVGILLLLDNLGYLPGVNLWGLIWPLLLIAAGGWILWNYFNRGSRQMEHIVIPMEEAARAELRFQHGAGRININAGTSPAILLEGDFGGGLDVRKNLRGDALELRLSLPGNIFPFDWSPGQSLDWSLSLNSGIPLSLSLETGASESHLNLRDLRVTELNLRSGASSTSVILPENAGMTKVDIRSGAASVTVNVPEGVAAQIRTSGGLSNIDVSNRFAKGGGLYQSSEYASAANKVDIYVEMGVGSVSIR